MEKCDIMYHVIVVAAPMSILVFRRTAAWTLWITGWKKSTKKHRVGLKAECPAAAMAQIFRYKVITPCGPVGHMFLVAAGADRLHPCCALGPIWSPSITA